MQQAREREEEMGPGRSALNNSYDGSNTYNDSEQSSNRTPKTLMRGAMSAGGGGSGPLLHQGAPPMYGNNTESSDPDEQGHSGVERTPRTLMRGVAGVSGPPGPLTTQSYPNSYGQSSQSSNDSSIYGNTYDEQEQKEESAAGE